MNEYRPDRRPSAVEQALAEIEESKREPVLTEDEGKAAVAEARRQLERSRRAKLDAQ